MNIKTDRLSLIPISTEHISDVFENFNENVITYMSPSVPKNISDTTAVVENFIKQREDKTDYVYCITLTSSREFIGLVGLHSINNAVPELGIWTKINSHGNHYGREAVGGVIDFARSLNIKKLVYPVDLRNTASKKIPMFYGGKIVTECKPVSTPDGRILQEVVYEITL